jgi:hypothetical protein
MEFGSFVVNGAVEVRTLLGNCHPSWRVEAAKERFRHHVRGIARSDEARGEPD